MNWLFSLLLTVHILVALIIIGLVLMQHGKGADMGAAFGSGSSGSLFGSSGSANFLSRMTGGLAAVFLLQACRWPMLRLTSQKRLAVLCRTRYNCRLLRQLHLPLLRVLRLRVIRAQRQKKYRSKCKKVWPAYSSPIG